MSATCSATASPCSTRATRGRSSPCTTSRRRRIRARITCRSPNGLMLLANGANIVRMQSYDNTRDYFENTLADSLTNRQPFRAGLSVFDIDTNPAEPREIAFLEMPGIGINRLWWTGGRYAYVVRAFRRVHGSHSLHRRSRRRHETRDRVALVVARHASRRRRDADGAAGQTLRAAPHDRRGRPRLRRVARRRAHDPRRERRGEPAPALAPQLVAAVSRRHAHGAAAAADASSRSSRTSRTRTICAKGLFYTWVVDVRADENPVPIATLPTPTGMRLLRDGQLRPAQPPREPAGSFVSEETIFATYHNAGVRVFDVRDQYQPKKSRRGFRRCRSACSIRGPTSRATR